MPAQPNRNLKNSNQTKLNHPRQKKIPSPSNADASQNRISSASASRPHLRGGLELLDVPAERRDGGVRAVRLVLRRRRAEAAQEPVYAVPHAPDLAAETILSPENRLWDSDCESASGFENSSGGFVRICAKEAV